MSNAQLTIAHILPWQAVGGTELATLRIAQAVEGPRFRHLAYCLADAPEVEELFASAGFETAAYQPVELSLRNPFPFLRASLELARDFRRRQISLVHCADVPAGNLAALAGRLAGLPVLCHVRNRYDKLSRFDQRGLRFVSRFAFVSRDTWRRFAYPVPSWRGTVVYDGIDVDHQAGPLEELTRREVRDELGLPQATRIIGMVARVDPQKDYQTLIRAAARVVRVAPDVRFLIVGGYSQPAENRLHYEKIKRELREHDVDRYFVFTDFRRDVPRLIRAMDIFVLCTHFEGFPLAILEAMAQARPVVATAVDGIPEIITSGKTGLLHPPGDDETLAEQIISMLNDRDRAQQLGQAARRAVQADFSRNAFAAQMRLLYSEMLGLVEKQAMPHAAAGDRLTADRG
jgi:glycosyltransferase involved in cell wall biosynthesis